MESAILGAADLTMQVWCRGTMSNKIQFHLWVCGCELTPLPTPPSAHCFKHIGFTNIIWTLIEKAPLSVAVEAICGCRAGCTAVNISVGRVLSDCKSLLITCKLCSRANVKVFFINEMELIRKTMA